MIERHRGARSGFERAVARRRLTGHVARALDRTSTRTR
jgi:hypothetical protein